MRWASSQNASPKRLISRDDKTYAGRSSVNFAALKCGGITQYLSKPYVSDSIIQLLGRARP